MTSRTLRALCLGALVAFLGCSAGVGGAPAPAATPAANARSFAVAQQNEALGTPSFVWVNRSDWPAFESADVAAREVLTAVAPTFQLAGDGALATLSPAAVHDTGRGGIVARFLQRLDGIEVFRAGLNVLMSRRLEPIAVSGLVAANLEHGARAFDKDASTALRIAHTTLTGRDTTFVALSPAGDYERFASGSPELLLAQPARAKRVYFPRKGGLEPAWYVELLLAGGGATRHLARSYVVSAVTGAILFTNDLVRDDAFTYRVWASSDTLRFMDSPQGNDAVPLVVPVDNGFRPGLVPQQLVTLQNYPFSRNDPWLAPGSTLTLGNNVIAYSDVAPPDGFTPNSADTMATTTSAGTFDYAYDTTAPAGSTPPSLKAAITQMFYTTNVMHDWYYDSGFDEKAGNSQSDNFGRGGLGGDPLHAEVDDYSGRNNANATTPADGASPTIQMYLFDGITHASFVVDAPAADAGPKTIGIAGQLGAGSFDLTGPVVVAVDGGGADPADACESLRAPAVGRIVLVHRGTCTFAQKAQNVQAAGGAGIIVANVASSSDPATAPFMGGSAPGVTIPAVSLDLADGAALEAVAASGVTVTMKRDPSLDLDGALDDNIVAHEWTHILSSRLIANGNGIDTNQARGLGEGWSDFSALLTTVRPDDIQIPANGGWAGAYPTATYATAGATAFYFGLRRVPYSIDFSKDPLTFKHISDGVPLPTNVPVAFGGDGIFNSEVHNTGEVWTTMLWECYASLLACGRLSFQEAQDRMKGYFVASLAMTSPSPTFIEARDALLATVYANDAEDFELFWQAFARRGAGVGALAPPRTSGDNKGVVESFVVGSAVSLVSLTLSDDVLTCDHDGIVDEGEIGTVALTLHNSGAGTLAKTTATLGSTSPSLSFVDGNVLTLEPFKPFETRTAKVRIYLDGTKDLSPVTISVAVSDPTLVKDGALALSLPARHGVDEVPDSSASDDVEPTNTAWVVSGTDVTGGTLRWHRILTGTNHSWFVPNAAEEADIRLTSPAFQVTGASFVLAWRHRWSFESSVADGKDFDGGVVEITLDDGKSWVDLSTYASMDYNVVLADDPGTTMVLKGRPAYGHDSPGYPDKWVESRILVSLPDPADNVHVRFRHGADENTAAVGWEIDDIEVTGLDNTPFWSFVPQRDDCDPAGPTAIAPPGQKVTPRTIVSLAGSGTSPRNLPIGFSWRQESGPPVYLSGRDTATLAFVAPDTVEPVTLTFALRANDGTLLSAAADVDVVVAPQTFSTDSGCACRTFPRAHGANGEGELAGAGLAAVALALVRRRRTLRGARR